MNVGSFISGERKAMIHKNLSLSYWHIGVIFIACIGIFYVLSYCSYSEIMNILNSIDNSLSRIDATVNHQYESLRERGVD